AIIANNYIYAFGGGKITDNGAGTDVGYQTFICAAGESGCGGGIVAPTVTNWTSATTENPMTTARHQMGIALESAIIYIMGGQSGTAATTSTEMTVW
ncbi:hypothetical protein KAI87_06490, partial [Myxococcota bacterium]|nr:hypothetical protein [Myxococcota bacterium]